MVHVEGENCNEVDGSSFGLIGRVSEAAEAEVPHDSEPDESVGDSPERSPKPLDDVSEPGDGSDDDISATTLELPGLGDEEVGDTDSDESSTPQGNSQRKGAWWGETYNELNRMDRLQRMVVPIETLYTWWVDGQPSGDAFQDTFSCDDLTYPSCCLHMFGWLSL